MPSGTSVLGVCWRPDELLRPDLGPGPDDLGPEKGLETDRKLSWDRDLDLGPGPGTCGNSRGLAGLRAELLGLGTWAWGPGPELGNPGEILRLGLGPGASSKNSNFWEEQLGLAILRRDKDQMEKNLGRKLVGEGTNIRRNPSA